MEEQLVETTVYSLADAPPCPGNRRSDERYMSLFRVGCLLIGDRRELCLIKNVSAGGMLIRAYCKIEPGTAVQVELKHGSLASGIVRWVEDQSVGISFDSPIDVVDLLAGSMDGPRPRMPRVEIKGVAWLRDDGIIHRVQARDISQGGIKIESRSEIDIGRDVVVTVTGLEPQPGVVRWRDSNFYGVTFNRVIPLPTLVEWLQGQRDQLRAAGSSRL